MVHALRPDWPAPEDVLAAVTTRVGGVSSGSSFGTLNLSLNVGDDPDAVAENRRRVTAQLAQPGAPAFLRQVHGIEVVRLAASSVEGSVADACWSAEPGVVCAVMMADCLPILFCDECATLVAAAHAGWRGLAGGVVEATVAALPVAASRLMAWLGPAIGPDAFAVGEDVRRRFVEAAPEAARAFRPRQETGQFDADLFELARQRLRAAGVGRIFGGGVCTYSDPARFFSFRRDGVCGRMAAMIWLNPATDSRSAR